MKAHSAGCASALFALLWLAGSAKSETSSAPASVDQSKPIASAGTTLTRFEARPGSKVRIEGFSTRSDWQFESTVLGGFIEVGTNFPTVPGQPAKPGKVEARAEMFVLIRSLKSVEKGGTPFSDEMDNIMYEKLDARDNSKAKITYYLTELLLRETANSNDQPYLFDSRGKLVVAGVTNSLAMPVSVLPLGDHKVRISGITLVRMTDFKIQPPSPTLASGPLKTGDEVKLIFAWVLGQKGGSGVPR